MRPDRCEDSSRHELRERRAAPLRQQLGQLFAAIGPRGTGGEVLAHRRRAARPHGIVEREFAVAHDEEGRGRVKARRQAAEREVGDRRRRHVLGLRRHAVRAVDEHLAVLRDEHRGHRPAVTGERREEGVDERVSEVRALDRAVQHATRTEVVSVARVKREKRLAGVVRLATAIDECLVAADDLRRVAAHEPCGSFILGHAK